MDLTSTITQDEEKIHEPQCSCNFKGLFHKTINSVFQLQPTHETCALGKKWCKLAKVPENSQQFYKSILILNYDKEILISSHQQIELDVTRTFTENTYFSSGPGNFFLKRVLYAFIKYNPKLGYVQGMNYIAASLLYHCTESDAFWLFLRLVYDYDLVQNYLPMLPGLEKHAHVVEFLMMESLPDLNEHLHQAGLIVQMFATEWCLTLLTSLLSLEHSQSFLQKFFKHRWIFFYKFLLEILDRLLPKLMSTNSLIKILEILNPPVKNSTKASLQFLKTLENSERLSWEKLTKIANKREINEQGISCLTANFETTSQFFSDSWTVFE